MKTLSLYAPEKFGNQPCCFHQATQEMRDAITGGCGPGGVGDYLVPDRLWFLSVKPACKIHDWQYYYGRTLNDKINADLNFKDNMVRIIKYKDSWWWLERLRLREAQFYYEMVKNFGGPSYWKSKTSLYELQSV